MISGELVNWWAGRATNADRERLGQDICRIGSISTLATQPSHLFVPKIPSEQLMPRVGTRE